MTDLPPRWCWKPAARGDLRNLGRGADLDADAPLFFLGAEGQAAFSRIEADGIAVFKSAIAGAAVYLVATDFRVRGGSFGTVNSQRLAFALREAAASRSPVLLVLDTLGARLMDGRTVFQESFRLVPELLALRRRSLLVTVATGNCLGLGALLFTLGHYRIAVGDARLNLTGPEVMRLFFGEQGGLLQQPSPPELLASTTLLHEVAGRVVDAWARFAELVRLRRGCDVGPPGDEAPALDPILARLGGRAVEVFAGGSPVVRAWLVRRGGDLLGVLMNPLGRPENLFTVAAVDKFAAALDLFEALEVPVISLLDTPGIDPRRVESERDLLMKLAQVAGRIVAYPHGRMGVVCGRAFGGANIFVLPRAFGGDACYALRGANIGIMHPSIVEQILAESPRLLQEWRAKRPAEGRPELEDLVAAGALDGVIDLDELPARVDQFLCSLSPRVNTDASAIPSEPAGGLPP